MADEIYVLTYMFRHSALRCFFDLHGLAYEMIGVRHVDGLEFQFVDIIPTGWTSEIPGKIIVFDNDKLNEIGDYRTALSSNWVRTQSKCAGNGKLALLKNHLSNYFRHYFGHIPSEQRLWSTFKSGVPALKGKGFANRDLEFNSRATNDFGDRRALAYCVNIFQNPSIKRYYEASGIEYDEDGEALSIMVQWLFRSAIRRGEEVHVYVPSRRMRELLLDWLA